MDDHNNSNEPTSISKHMTTVGGQALIEGLLMIGPKHTSIAIRKPDGEIEVKNAPPLKKGFISKVPIVRGSVLLIRQMIIGIKALMFSAQFLEVEPSTQEDPDIEEKTPSTSFSQKFDRMLERLLGDKAKDVVIFFSVLLSLSLSVGLFMLLPNILASLVMIPFGQGSFQDFSLELIRGSSQNFSLNFLRNAIEGILRITIFLLYLSLVGKISSEIKRVWQYHGAEHKTIHCYENREPLTVENIKKYTTLHPRCGTSFVFTVLIVSIVVFSFVGWHGVFLNLILRLLLVPIVAGVSYEMFKYIGKKENKFADILKKPGLLFQKLTTAEPDESMIEVAIVAMNNALSDNIEDDKW